MIERRRKTAHCRPEKKNAYFQSDRKARCSAMRKLLTAVGVTAAAAAVAALVAKLVRARRSE